jgi:glycerophosphoryl diester phosphodiesterase
LRTLNAPAWLTERPIAHRGLHDPAQGVIENTASAALAAIDAGFAIECDVQMSGDEEVFVFHDDALDRLTDSSGALIDKPAAEIARARIKGSEEPPPTFAEFLGLIAGRTPVICELKSRFDGDWRIGDRVCALASAYEGPLALKSFDPDLVAYLRLRSLRLGVSGRRCPIGVVAQASYDDSAWDVLRREQKRECVSFDHRGRTEPDFLSWNVDDLPHKTPFFEKELYRLPVMAWTVRTQAQREAARKWADQIVFEGAGRP